MRESEDNRANKQIIVMGKHPVIELLQNGKPVQKVFILRTLKGPTEIDVRRPYSLSKHRRYNTTHI